MTGGFSKIADFEVETCQWRIKLFFQRRKNPHCSQTTVPYKKEKKGGAKFNIFNVKQKRNKVDRF